MEIQFYGANCVRLTTKKINLVIDDNLTDFGLKSPFKAGDIALFTTGVPAASPKDAKLVIDQPGEYEVSSISIQGVAARSHMNEEGEQSTTIFKIINNDLRVVVTGHIHPDLTDSQLESIGTVDVLIVPVGGNGYTLDSVGALKVIKEIDPKLVIPTHFADAAINYPVPQQELPEALRGLSMEVQEAVPKLKLNKASDLSEASKLVVLERQ